MATDVQPTVYEAELDSIIRSLETSLGSLPTVRAVRLVADPSHYLHYQQLIHRVRGIVRATIPRDATVLVVSKGDEDLLQLDGRQGWHFPQTETGIFAGQHPIDSNHAIAHLEALRARGAAFLLFPETAFWWLDYYATFVEYLDRFYTRVVHQHDACRIYALHTAQGALQ